MSHPANDELFERAREVMEYHTGTYLERVIQRDLDSDDLESLQVHIKQGEDIMAMEHDAELRGELDVA